MLKQGLSIIMSWGTELLGYKLMERAYEVIKS